jgi:hypothetical protein
MLTYFESPHGDFSPQIQTLCDKLVVDLHNAGVTGIRLRRKLGLTPRSRFMQFHHQKGESNIERIERSFVETMRRLGIDERHAISFGDTFYDCSDFPETHDYLLRSFSRLEKALHAARIEDAKNRDLEVTRQSKPVSHGAATLADILGSNANKPNKRPA